MANKRGRPKKNKEIPLSKESEEKVKQGLKEAREGKTEKLIITDKDRIERDTEETKENLYPPVTFKENPNLKKAVGELTKAFGHDVFHYASAEPIKERLAFVVPEVNQMITGIQMGSFSILWGNKSCAKTTATYYFIAQAQKLGKACAYFDLENGFDLIWAEKCGVDLNRLLIGHFENAEEAMDSLIKLCKTKSIDFVVLDSVHSLSPEGEQETKKGVEKSTSDNSMALLARRLSQFFRMSNDGLYRGKVGVLLIGQARVDLGSFIKLEKLTGGHALSHYSCLTLKMMRGQKVDAPVYKFSFVNAKGAKKTKQIIIGFSLVIKIEKTKISGTAPENSEIRIPFYYEYGFIKPTDEQIETLYKDFIEYEKESEEE